MYQRGITSPRRASDSSHRPRMPEPPTVLAMARRLDEQASRTTTKTYSPQLRCVQPDDVSILVPLYHVFMGQFETVARAPAHHSKSWVHSAKKQRG